MTVREILEKLFDNAYDEATFKHKDLKDTIVDQALKEIVDLLPKKKYHKKVSMLEFNPDLANQIEGYNQCLKDIKERLNE
jgi:hypothetical protein